MDYRKLNQGTCLLACLLGLLTIVESANDPNLGRCGPGERWLDGSCQACPACVGGTGLDEDCGFGVGATAGCQICQEGITYSREITNVRTCTNCTSCADDLHRTTTSNCTIYENTKCGVCLEGWYGVEPVDHPQIPTPSCYPCAETARGERTQCDLYWQRIDEAEEEQTKATEGHINTLYIVLGIVIFIGTSISLVYFYRKRETVNMWWKKHRGPKAIEADSDGTRISQAETGEINMAQEATK